MSEKSNKEKLEQEIEELIEEDKYRKAQREYLDCSITECIEPMAVLVLWDKETERLCQRHYLMLNPEFAFVVKQNGDTMRLGNYTKPQT